MHRSQTAAGVVDRYRSGARSYPRNTPPLSPLPLPPNARKLRYRMRHFGQDAQIVDSKLEKEH